MSNGTLPARIHQPEPSAEEPRAGTQFPDLFAALAQPFESKEVKTRPQGKTLLHYVTARTVMNRLDAVLGPENWWDEYTPHQNSVLCGLTIRLPNGQTLTKHDAGGYAGMADQGDDDKSGYSDAFKRAAVKFGVARYLYRDGVPGFVQEATPAKPDPRPSKGPTQSQPRQGPTQTQPARPAPRPEPPFDAKSEVNRQFPPTPPPAERVQTWQQYASRRVAETNKAWRDHQAAEGVPEGDHSEKVTDLFRVLNAFVTTAIDTGVLAQADVADPKSGNRDRDKAKAQAERIFRELPQESRNVIEAYLSEKLEEGKRSLGIVLGDEDVAGDVAANLERRGREPGED